MSIKFKMTNVENGEVIELTDHTINNIEEREDRIDSENILLSKTVDGVVVEGKLNFVDDSDEVLNACKISEWVKITPHEKGSEVSLEIEMTTVGGEVYSSYKYEKAFLQHYEEKFDLSNGTGSFSFFVRNKDELENTLGARIVPLLEGNVSSSGEVGKFNRTTAVSTGTAIVEGAHKSDNIVTVYKEKTATKYDEADVITNGVKRVKISIQGNSKEYDGYNHSAVVVKGDVLNTIVGLIDTTVKNGTTVSTRDYYELEIYGQTHEIDYTDVYNIKKDYDSLYFLKYKLSTEEKLFVTTIYTEASIASELEWKAVAYTIMNRLKNPRDVWHNAKTITDIVTQDWQYSGIHLKDDNYTYAQDYLNNRDGTSKTIEEIINAVIPIYRGTDTDDYTDNAVYFYSPRSMKPANTVPRWVNASVEEVFIYGIDRNYFRFYKFKN